jgi:hypothetical protein
MNGHAVHVQQPRLLIRAIFDDLVDRAGLYAMRRRQHQLGRDQGAGAEIAAGADDGNDRAADSLAVGTPPPTMAEAGAEANSTIPATIELMLFIAAAVARTAPIAKAWSGPPPRVSRFTPSHGWSNR